MADDQNTDASHPQPLDYRRLDYGRTDAQPVTNAVASIAGAVMAIGLVGILAAIFYPYPLSHGGVKPVWWAVVTFFALPIVAMVAISVLWQRRPLRTAGYFWAGVWVGLGLIGLLEGMCYANPCKGLDRAPSRQG
jgi:hypothetical protein